MTKQRTMSRRQFLGVSAGVTAGIALMGLNNPNLTARALQDKVTVTLWHGWTGADNTDALNAVIAKFNTDNKDGITIEPTALPWDDFFSKSVVAAAGSPMDIALYHSSELPEYAVRGITIPIEDYIKELGINLEGVPPAVISACKWEGKAYAVPGDLHPLGMYYRTDLG